MGIVRAMLAVAAVALPAGISDPGAALAQADGATRKLNAYVGCINRLSERAHASRTRYFSWAGKNGPTGKEKIVYGVYTIYDPSGCKKSVEDVSTFEPRDTPLEAAASVYVDTVVALEAILKEADEYYRLENYKDDKMARGKSLHPGLVRAWDAFAKADATLRSAVESVQNRGSAGRLAEIEKSEGKNARYHIEALMLSAKALVRIQSEAPADGTKLSAALADYEAAVKAAETYAAANPYAKMGSSFVDAAKTMLVSAKQLVRRVRDRTPYSQGEKMILSAGGGAGAWMIEGSPARLTRDYNQLVESYNRGTNF